MKTHSMNKQITPARTRRSPLICLLLLLGCLAQSQARAETYVCGVAMGTWTKANSPYILTCDVLVADLVIQPGVTVCASNYTFEVAGVLTAIGTASEPIVFKACNPAVGWRGIFFNYSSPGSRLVWCSLSNAVSSAVSIRSSAPSFEHCTFTQNSSSYGGGLYVDTMHDDLLLRNCTFTGNTAQNYGGAICATMGTNLLELDCCTIQDNSANPSGAVGGYLGGGAYISGNARTINTLVTGNVCRGAASTFQTYQSQGGGLDHRSGTLTLLNSTFKGNSVQVNTYYNGVGRAYGGGVSVSSGSVVARNCIVDGNVVSGPHGSYGAGMYISDGSGRSSLVNCTLAYNNTTGVESSSDVPLMNSILYFNAGGGTQIGGAVNVTYCDVQNGVAGQGNINFQPIFQSQTNLMIVPGSRCIDAGNPATAYNDSCFNGRFSLGTVRNDMGAHGGPGACCWECGSCTIPVIRSQPQPARACVGSSATFSVGATGSQPLSYQWRFHGTNCAATAVDILGATNASYTIPNVQSNLAGCYSVRVSNPLGSVDSDRAMLTVTPVCVVIDLYAGLNMSGGIPGQQYRILSTLNLTPPVTWTSNTSFTMPPGGLLWIDTNTPANNPKKFYLVTP